MPTENYQPSYTTAFSQVYDLVMRDVNYPTWAAHIVNLCDHYRLPCDDVLNVACGTGNLDARLTTHGMHLTGIDLSAPMVDLARIKASDDKLDIEYHVAPMQSFQLDRQFDTVLCLYDSLNYVIEPADVQAAFARAFEHTRPGGGYIFDITTEHNIIHNFAHYTFAENLPQASYIWENDYSLRTKLCCSRLTIFLHEHDDQYRRCEEDHVQRIYATRDLAKWLKDAGWILLGKHDGLTMDPVHSRSERIHFVCRRPA